MSNRSTTSRTLTSDQILQIRKMYKDGIKVKEIAKRFNISTATVSRYRGHYRRNNPFGI